MLLLLLSYINKITRINQTSTNAQMRLAMNEGEHTNGNWAHNPSNSTNIWCTKDKAIHTFIWWKATVIGSKCVLLIYSQHKCSYWIALFAVVLDIRRVCVGVCCICEYPDMENGYGRQLLIKNELKVIARHNCDWILPLNIEKEWEELNYYTLMIK